MAVEQEMGLDAVFRAYQRDHLDIPAHPQFLDLHQLLNQVEAVAELVLLVLAALF